MSTIKQAITEAVERGKHFNISVVFILKLCRVSANADTDEIKGFNTTN